MSSACDSAGISTIQGGDLGTVQALVSFGPTVQASHLLMEKLLSVFSLDLRLGVARTNPLHVHMKKCSLFIFAVPCLPCVHPQVSWPHSPCCKI
eukprot:1161404-Pelagomonas_calceolata.AAC.9